MDEQKAILQGIWRKAGKDGDLTIPCDSKQQATRLRFALYNAVKGVKTGERAVDEALLSAVRDFSVIVKESSVQLYRKAETELMGALKGLLQDSPELIVEGEEEAARQSAEKAIRQSLENAGIGGSSTDSVQRSGNRYFNRQEGE